MRELGSVPANPEAKLEEIEKKLREELKAEEERKAVEDAKAGV